MPGVFLFQRTGSVQAFLMAALCLKNPCCPPALGCIAESAGEEAAANACWQRYWMRIDRTTASAQ